MNEKKETLYIYHLYRKEGDSLLIHPFVSPEKLISTLETSKIEGKYGREPNVEALTVLKNQLYRMAELWVRTWISDLKFIPRFLLSALVFLAAYFFCAFVIRDPIPVLDEILISFGCSFVTYILLGRKDAKSDMAAKKRLSLKNAIDRILFTESDFVKNLEDYLHENESSALEVLIKEIINPSIKHKINEDNREEAKQFIKTCEMSFKIKDVKKSEKMLAKYLKQSRTKNITHSNVKKWERISKIDFPLYAVYKQCKNTFVKQK
jgi:hypothetical protein